MILSKTDFRAACDEALSGRYRLLRHIDREPNGKPWTVALVAHDLPATLALAFCSRGTIKIVQRHEPELRSLWTDRGFRGLSSNPIVTTTTTDSHQLANELYDRCRDLLQNKPASVLIIADQQTATDTIRAFKTMAAPKRARLHRPDTMQ